MSLRWRTLLSRSDLRHRSGLPETLWSIFSLLTPLFCVVNVSVTNVATWRSASAAVSAKMLRPQPKAMSSRQKGVLSDLAPVQSPGRRKRNYVIIIMLHTPLEEGSPLRCAWGLGGGSALLDLGGGPDFCSSSNGIRGGCPVPLLL